MVANHLSYLGPEATPSKELPIDDFFLGEKLLGISHQAIPWYANLVNYEVCRVLPPGLPYPQKKTFMADAKYYVWEEPLLHKLCGDVIYRRILQKDEVSSALNHCYALAYGGHFGLVKTIAKVVQIDFY